MAYMILGGPRVLILELISRLTVVVSTFQVLLRPWTSKYQGNQTQQDPQESILRPKALLWLNTSQESFL